MSTNTTDWYTPITSAEAIKVIRKHKGKAFVTIAQSEFLVAVEKSDLTASMQTDVDNGNWCKWCIRIADWGMDVMAHQD